MANETTTETWIPNMMTCDGCSAEVDADLDEEFLMHDHIRDETFGFCEACRDAASNWEEPFPED